MVFLIPLSSHGMRARITDFLVSNNEKTLLVYFRVTDCFTKKMDDAIMAGVPATFFFTIELSEERPLWFNKIVAKVEVRHTLKYDSVKNVYFVKSTENNNEPLEFQDFNLAKRAMEDLSGISVAPIDRMHNERRYFVGVKAKLDRIRLPLNLEHVFFFVSLWDFETDWHRHSFTFKK